MKKAAQKLWVRVLGLILFCVCAAVSTLGLYLYRYALEDGWYNAMDTAAALVSDTETAEPASMDEAFVFSDMCLDYISECLSFTAENLRWLQDPTSLTLGGWGGRAFSYKIISVGGPIVTADTTGEGSQLVTGIDVSFVTDSGYERNFYIEGYVNLPVQPYDGCYREYFTFTHLYPARNCYLPIGVVCALLAVLALAFSLVFAVLAGRTGHVTILGRTPFDVTVIGLYLLVRLVQALVWRLPGSILTVLGRMDIIPGASSLYISILAFSLGGVILADQLAAGVWREQLLLRRLVLKISPVTLIAVLLGGHLGAIVLTFLIGGEFRYGLVLLILGAFDLVLLPCFIRWVIEARRIQKASGALAAGDLTYKLNTAHLHMTWKTLGEDLNSIGDGMLLAVDERMRSERLKTELITNVSHDLKTPLTSIINYIDLLKNDDLPEDVRKEYIHILERQSGKLKKLTEDVVEASKAASGAVTVNADLFDVGELLEQSVGEYSERLQEAGVEPVIHTPEEMCRIWADARLLGRVLDNFITNIIKYAQPGTRAYFDLIVGPEETIIEVKNTSREPLDIPVEELMERFVRGDSSRSSEGSGLGLSIARSLTELMGGQMRLVLDGDLFKAEVRFPNVTAHQTDAKSEEPAV